MSNKPNNNKINPLNKYFIMSYVGYICGMWTSYLMQLYGLFHPYTMCSIITTATFTFIAYWKVPENGFKHK